MKNFLAYALLLAPALVGGCKKDADLVECAEPAESLLTTIAAKHEAPVQRFTMSPNTTASIRTAAGSVITVPAGLVRVDGQRLSGSPVQVQVREVTKRSEMIFTHTPTLSNGDLLESGGMFNVAFQQDGQPLRLAAPSRLLVATVNPAALSSSNNMRLFTARPDSVNQTQINSWTPVNTQSAQDSSRIFPSTTKGFQVVISPTIYNVNLGQLNWFNIDRFLPVVPRTFVRINVVRPNVTYATTRTFLSFTTLNSVLVAGFNASSGIFSADQVPIGYSVTAVVLHQEGSQLYFGKQTATIAANQQFTPALRPVTETELVAEIQAL